MWHPERRADSHEQVELPRHLRLLDRTQPPIPLHELSIIMVPYLHTKR
jgi:hypothetical protein